MVLTLPLQSASILAMHVARVSTKRPAVLYLRQIVMLACVALEAVSRTTTSATDHTQGGLVVAVHPFTTAGNTRVGVEAG